MNKVLELSDLKCPPKEVECALRKLISQYVSDAGFVKILSITATEDSDSIQDKKLIGGTIQYIILNGTQIQPPFDFDKITGTITIDIEEDDVITIFYT